MLVIMSILIVAIIACFLLNIRKDSNEDREFRLMTSFFAILFSILLGIIVHELTTPTIEDYVNGRVETKIVTTVKDGEVIKCDTLYYKLRK